MLRASPQAGFSEALLDVICFQFPNGPAQTSGGRLKDCRITADVLPSAASETAAPQRLALICSGPCQSVSMLLSFSATAATPVSPSTSSPKIIFCPPGAQVSQLAEAFIPGVMLRASPPEAGTTKMSPPTDPSS